MIPLALLVACLQAPTLDAEAGFQGKVFPDSWTRFSAVVTYEGAPLDAELRITIRSFTQEPVVFRRPLRLVRKAKMRLGYDLYLTSRDYAAEVELVEGSKILQTTSLTLRPITTSETRLLVVGSPPDLVGDAMTKKPPVILVRLPTEQLPSTSLSLSSVDRILMAEPIPLDPGQETALLHWVREGGTLIFGAGRSTHLRQNAFWRDLCPLATPEAAAISVPSKTGDFSMNVVRGRRLRGRETFGVAGESLVIRAREGAGEVIFMPVVLDQPGLGRVVNGPQLLAEILDLPPPPKEELIPSRRGPILRTAEWTTGNKRTQYLQETVEFLRRAIPAEFSLRIGPIATAVLAMAGYVLLIGPVEYTRLRRRGRLRSGWRSFALLVLIFGTLVALWGSLISTRESKFVLVSLMDEQRVRTYGVLRPATGGIYDLESSGPMTPLPPTRQFGATDVGESITANLPSGARLAMPPTSTRLMVASRPVADGEGVLTAEWATSERKSIKVKNGTTFPILEGWVVAKDAVWSAPGFPAGSESTIELKGAVTFETWADQQMKDVSGEAWARYDTRWTKLSAPRFGLILSFYESLNTAKFGQRIRHQLIERGVDLSPELERGGLVLIGSFDRNVSTLRCTPEISPITSGWARARVREAVR